MTDENDDVTASVRDIERENARLGVRAIRLQSKASRDPKRTRLIKVKFLDTNKVNRMGRDKVH